MERRLACTTMLGFIFFFLLAGGLFYPVCRLLVNAKRTRQMTRRSTHPPCNFFHILTWDRIKRLYVFWWAAVAAWRWCRQDVEGRRRRGGWMVLVSAAFQKRIKDVSFILLMDFCEMLLKKSLKRILRFWVGIRIRFSFFCQDDVICRRKIFREIKIRIQLESWL